MSKSTATPLLIEWTPGRVRASNGLQGDSVEARSLSELGSIVRGHSQAIVGVGHSHVFMKALRLPKAAADDLRSVLAIRLAQLFPLPPDQLSFDFIQTTDQTVEGCLTIVAAMRSELLRDLRAELKEVGLTPLRILPISLASAAVAAKSGLRDALIVEKSPSGLVLDVVQAGIVRFSRCVAADSDPEVEAKRTLSAAKSGDLTIITVGSIGIPGSRKSGQGAVDLLAEAPPFDFELMEERVASAKRRVANRLWMATAFGLVALAVVTGVYLRRSQSYAYYLRNQGTFTRKITTMESIASADSGIDDRLAMIRGSLTRAFDPAQPVSDISAVIDDCLPQGAWLTGLTIERGKTIDIRGTAASPTDVPKFVQALGEDPRFRDVTMVFANSSTIGQTPVVQFDVSAVAIGNLPMPAPPKVTRSSSNSLTANLTSEVSGQ